MKYISNLREGERVGDIYLCKTKQAALTKAGKPYESLTLQDKTGTLDAKIWDPNSQGIEEFEALDYIAVVGDVTSFQGALQLNIKRVRKVREGEYDPKEYLPVSEEDIDRQIAKYLEKIMRSANFYRVDAREHYKLQDKLFKFIGRLEVEDEAAYRSFQAQVFQFDELCAKYQR